MRLPLPALLAMFGALPLAHCLQADDDIVPPVPGMVIEERPETVVIGEDAHDYADGDLHYEMDSDEHEDCHDDHDDFHHRPDSHAPAGVMADHTHKQGEWMTEYKFMYMNMQNMSRQTTQLTPQQVFDQTGVAVSPTDMNMKMSMAHIMYGLTDNITLYTMLMWTDLAMDHVPNPLGPVPVPFRIENSAFDDMIVGANINLYEDCNSQWIGSFGLVLPTGDIGRRIGPGVPPAGQVYPYPMRVGSGSISLRPALTYKRWNECGSIGVQAIGYIPLNENYRDYRLGSQARVSFWISRLLSESTSASFRVEGFWQGNVDGADPELNPAQVTTANPLWQGRSVMNLYGGLNKIVCGHRFAVEMGAPIYQNVRGYQLEQDFFLFTSWSKAF